MPLIALLCLPICGWDGSVIESSWPMNDSHDQNPNQSDEKSRGDRLESWKRISNYLNRDIRTLRRWEKNEGLPIHRHMHESLATVYAYQSELDAWLASRSAATGTAGKTRRLSPARKKQWSVALAVVVLAIAVVLVLKMQAVTAELPFEARDWILITKFENRTGEDVFEGTLEYALQRELSNSQFVNVVSRERIGDSLAMMKLPADSIVNQEIGKEISLRDGGIKALITGRIDKLGTSYLLGAELIEPASGVSVASFSQTAEGEDLLATAVRNLANEVRETLGEALADIASETTALEKVTTPSLRALQLYSQADAIFTEQKSLAYQLLLQAVEIDPDFASAHVLLGFLFEHWGDGEQSGFYFQRAMDLAVTVTERERYFILASFYRYHEFDRAKAVNVLELLLRRYPDHYWANSNMEWIHRQLGQPLRALPYAMRRADLRPNNFILQIFAVQKILQTGSSQDHLPYLERAKDLASEEWQRAWVHALDAAKAWLEGDFIKAHSMVLKFHQEAAAESTDYNGSLSWRIAMYYLALGRLQDAKALLLEWTTAPEMLALFHLATGDTPALGAYLADAEATHRTAILLARVGRTAEAETVLANPAIRNRLDAPLIVGYWDRLAGGELALAKGAYREAISLFEMNAKIPPMWPTAFFFLGADGLASAQEQLGDIDAAIKTLEYHGRELKGSIFWSAATLFWMKNQLRLMELYARTGQPEKAGQIEIVLRELLSVADADHPVLQSLDTLSMVN